MATRRPFLRSAAMVVALGSLASSSWRPARASMVPAMDLARLTAGANRIVVGEILSTTASWDEHRRRIFTTIEVQVAEMWKGAMPPGRRFRFTQLGGSV